MGLVVAGAPEFDRPDLFFAREGAAFVFDATTGQQLRILVSPTPWQDERFGYGVGVSGNRALVGAYNSGSTDHSGAAYIFDVNTGAALNRITPNDPQFGAQFGSAVSIQGNYALVGAPHYQNDVGNIYLFDASTGQQMAKFSITPTSSRDYFGWSTAISQSTAVIGAPGGFTVSSGNVYLFDLATQTQRAQLSAPDLVAGSRFGIDVAISGGLVIVGATESLGGVGAGYLFDASDGTFLRKLVPSDGTPGDEFGLSVALDGRFAIIGSRTDQNVLNAGSVYVFDVLTGQQVDRFAASIPTQNSDFGWSLALDGDTAAIGTSGKFAYAAHYIPVPEPSCLSLFAAAILFASRRVQLGSRLSRGKNGA